VRPWIQSVLHAAIGTVLLVVLGCSDGAIEVAREAADRQALQNQEMARLNHEMATGARRLVEADAAVREQAFRVQQDLDAQRAELSAGFGALEMERKAIVASRRTESALVALVRGGGAAAAGILALAIAWLAFFGITRHGECVDADHELLLIDLMLADRAVPPQVAGQPQCLPSVGEALNSPTLLPPEDSS
jgi:hypothetical protein